MCFANSVLQVLVYYSSFGKLFFELGRLGLGVWTEGEKIDGMGEGDTSMVDATVGFFDGMSRGRCEAYRSGLGMRTERGKRDR